MTSRFGNRDPRASHACRRRRWTPAPWLVRCRCHRSGLAGRAPSAAAAGSNVKRARLNLRPGARPTARKNKLFRRPHVALFFLPGMIPVLLWAGFKGDPRGRGSNCRKQGAGMGGVAVAATAPVAGCVSSFSLRTSSSRSPLTPLISVPHPTSHFTPRSRCFSFPYPPWAVPILKKGTSECLDSLQGPRTVPHACARGQAPTRMSVRSNAYAWASDRHLHVPLPSPTPLRSQRRRCLWRPAPPRVDATLHVGDQPTDGLRRGRRDFAPGRVASPPSPSPFFPQPPKETNHARGGTPLSSPAPTARSRHPRRSCGQEQAAAVELNPRHR